MITTVSLGEGVGAAFTGRAGGRSAAPFDSLNLGGAVGDDPAAVRDNRRRVAAALGVAPERIVWMRQVHGADVEFVTRPFADDPAPGVDAIVTTVPGLALAVLVADCAPVLLADPVARVVGAAHSGRPGTAAGVVPALVARMREHGADPARIVAAIGPAACGGCYEVPAAMRDEVAARAPEAYATTRAGTPGLDIRAGIVGQLKADGVTDIRVDPRCTIETPELFSYRREGRTGRFAGFVWLTGDDDGASEGVSDDGLGDASAGGRHG
ncbi:laccase domain protein [Actinomadura rubrobrunea]|uniref:Purine nucleoside phosphorylase n=1 Tax=Actinomadura rubrobrunea TaxID=115335 RepID=A0A9W6PUP5_9ACTN|nr:peptidoglycan editing factor PgeF [Actinomadura rubrobrunea]GLW63162.1 laccase domain protein [Actinomadura rubrobrunea]